MKTVDFSETIVAFALIVRRCIQIIKFMKVRKYSRSRPFLNFAQGHLHMKIKTCSSKKPLGHFNQFLYVSFRVHENKNSLR